MREFFMNQKELNIKQVYKLYSGSKQDVSNLEFNMYQNKAYHHKNSKFTVIDVVMSQWLGIFAGS